jgi:hypothetical protein
MKTRLGASIGVMAAVGAVILFVSLFVEPSNTPKKNQYLVLGLLRHASPIFKPEATGPSIDGVTLGERVTLRSGRTTVAVGYVLTLNVVDSAFTIGAKPEVPGKTGLASFFRDGSGGIRFEPAMGRVADAQSRLWHVDP